MTRRVLLICYYFPPLGLGGVGRPLNLFRELPALGWDCHVLTVKPVAYRAYEPELLEGLDLSKIYRAGSRDPQRLMYLLGVRTIKAGTISRTKPIGQRFFPDGKNGWVQPAVRLGRTLCENRRYDVVISTSPPVSSHLIGQQLHRDYGIPWVADFRDYWSIQTIEGTFADPRLIERGHELLRSIREEASAVCAVNDSVGSYVGATNVIPNGYIAEYAEYWRTPPDGQRFTLGVVEHMHDRSEPTALLDMLERLRKLDPGRLAAMRLLHVGLADEPWLRSLFSARGLNIDLSLAGRLSREETIRALSRAHVLFLQIGPQDTPAFMPGRSMELIASGRPMLVYAPPDGDLCKALRGWPIAKCFYGGGEEDACAWLRRQQDAFASHAYRYEPLSEFAAQYSSRRLTERFANMMNGLL